MLTLPSGAAGFEKPFAFFREIAAIPRGSFHCEAIADYLCAFAEKRGLFCLRDAHHNVLIRKSASEDRKDKKPVILQGHTDMVAVKRDGCRKDLEKDGLDLKIENGELYAEGTSLGGDDGFFVASALAILDDESLSHPPIEALFTADEEVGLLGAAGFDCGVLEGKTLINLDSDAEGVFTFGCAGGVRCDSVFSATKTPVEGKVYTVSLFGLAGGHSGIEIGKGRANAITALAGMLDALGGFRLVSFDGGAADNVIPSSASITFVSPFDPTEPIKKSFEMLTNDYKNAENGMKIEIRAQDTSVLAFEENTSKSLIRFIAETPFGVHAMSRDLPGLVETSENPGIVKTDGGTLTLTVSVRSSVIAEKEKQRDALAMRTVAAGGTFSTRGDYPAWEYKKDSRIRDTACEVFRSVYGKDPVCDVVHAGLECGIFSDRIEGLDAISLGPDIKAIHSSDERLSLTSSASVFAFLLSLLRSL